MAKVEDTELSVSGSFTATGNSDSIACHRALILVSGTFTGTVRLRARDESHGVFVEAGSAYELTAPGTILWDPGVGVEIDLECSDLPSGTINFLILRDGRGWV